MRQLITKEDFGIAFTALSYCIFELDMVQIHEIYLQRKEMPWALHIGDFRAIES